MGTGHFRLLCDPKLFSPAENWEKFSALSDPITTIFRPFIPIFG
jgi:hypothetical protein